MSVAPLFTSPPPSPTNLVTGLGATFPPKNITNIADALSSASGLAQNGTINNALQPQNTSPITGPNPNSILAATLNPGVNLQVSTQLQVADFVNTAANAFPTSAPAAPTPTAAPQPSDNSNGSPPSGGQTPSSSNTLPANTAVPQPTPDNSAAASIYSAVASANNSTIRGSGLNVSA